MRKLDYLYSDIRDDLMNTYMDQKENLSNSNIASFNDYITDDVIGEGGFKHPLDGFYNVLTICLAMNKLNLMDEYFFEDIDDYIKCYNKGEYDNYLFNKKEDKKELDKDIKTVLNYYKKHKDAK